MSTLKLIACLCGQADFRDLLPIEAAIKEVFCEKMYYFINADAMRGVSRSSAINGRRGNDWRLAEYRHDDGAGHYAPV